MSHMQLIICRFHRYTFFLLYFGMFQHCSFMAFEILMMQLLCGLIDTCNGFFSPTFDGTMVPTFNETMLLMDKSTY